MAPISDDRDRNFENALARHVRADSQSETPSALPSCADIEALAAYHEGAFPPEQRSLWKTHIQDCPRCQEILAQLQATDAIPLGIPHNSEQKTVGVPVTKPRTPSLWRWAAPAGALAAGLLVWITVRENKPLQIAEVHSRKEASSDPQIAAPKPSEPESKAQRTNENPSAGKRSVAANAGGVVQRKLEPNRTGRFSAVPAKPASTVGEQNAETSVDLYASAPQQPEVRNRADAMKKDLKEKASASRLSPAAPAQAPAPEASPRISAMSETVAVEAASPAPLEETKSATVSPSDQIVLQQKQHLPLNGRSYDQVLTVAKRVSAVTVAAPHGSAQWRLGAAGIVEYSSDAGVTWTLQSTGVVADLLAGSATSDKVCWIVGRAGTIVRTTDGGAHWSKVPPPIVDDFASVFAVNERQATVSPAHSTYQTKDAGTTWRKLAPE